MNSIVFAMGFAFCCLGPVLLVVGYHRIRWQLAFQAAAKKATGIVTEVLVTRQWVGRRGPDRTEMETYFAPVFVFKTESGAQFTHRSDVYVSPNRYKVGMELEILYDPANPAVAQENHRMIMWIWPVAILILGIMSVVLGVLTMNTAS